MKDANVVEVVLFKPQASIKREAILETLSVMQATVEAKKGFVSRQVLENEDGQWLDLLWWESLDDALKAAEEVQHDPELAPHFAIFEGAEMTMMHLHPVQLSMLES